MKTKEEIADLASKISEISNLTLEQLSGKVTPDMKESYLLGLLSRTTIILMDIEKILLNNRPNYITSAFILFRCLLDDFIHLIHLVHKDFEEEEVIKITADAHRQRFKMIEESKKMNERFFDGNFDQLQTNEKERALRKSFTSNPNNDIFFANKEDFRFKKFPSMQQLVDSLPNTDIGKANIHSFVIWKFLSQYVHFSNLTFYLENDADSRQIEIDQLEEILFYCYKTVVLIFNELKVKHEFLDWKDPKEVGKYFDGLSRSE